MVEKPFKKSQCKFKPKPNQLLMQVEYPWNSAHSHISPSLIRPLLMSWPGVQRERRISKTKSDHDHYRSLDIWIFKRNSELVSLRNGRSSNVLWCIKEVIHLPFVILTFSSPCLNFRCKKKLKEQNLVAIFFKQNISSETQNYFDPPNVHDYAFC